MRTYRDGQLSLTAGSQTVIGLGTAFIDNVAVGDMLMVETGQCLEIMGVVDDTTLTVDVPVKTVGHYDGYDYVALRFVTPTNYRNLSLSIESFLTDRTTSLAQFDAWVNGVVGGGPNGDGRYPLSDRYGNTVFCYCPAALQSGYAGALAAAATAVSNAAQTTSDAATASSAATAAVSAANAALPAAAAAATSQTNAKTSETNSKTSETNAKTSETNSAASATAAAGSATAAGTSASNAKTSETNAKTSETNAKTSETNAGSSATSATASQSAAKTSETNAKTSETNAKSSETNAAGSATAASNSATAASNSASAAASSATAAQAAKNTYVPITDQLDTTAGHVLTTGAGGINGVVQQFTGNIDTGAPLGRTFAAQPSGTMPSGVTFGLLDTCQMVGNQGIIQRLHEITGGNGTLRTFERFQYGSLAWGPWRKVYKANDILLAVADDATNGGPAGGIIETGANSGGQYTKYADGTMICKAYIQTTISLSSQYGSGGFYNSYPWSFPATFVGTPACVSHALISGRIVLSAPSGASQPSYQYFFLYDPLTSAPAANSTVYLHFIAVGRWKA